MKTIDIIGKNYHGHWDKTRTACRGIVTDGNLILLSFEVQTGQWMLPGGGVEGNESDEACCIREIAEETGIITVPSPCLLEIDEYYENCKWVNRYFVCKAIDTTETKLTDKEKEVGMEKRWIPISEIKYIFSQYPAFEEKDEIRRGLYFREYTALKELGY